MPASVPAQGTATPSAAFASQSEKLSYAIGLTIADTFKGRTEFQSASLVSGLQDGLANKPKLTDQEKQEVINAYQAEIQRKREAELAEIGQRNAQAGAEFLANNKKQSGVVTLSSGLQYKVITSGTGKNRKSPKETDTVTVHYRGTLIDGTEFDSSYKRNQPATFPLNGVIKGWTEALQKMKPGDKWMLYIPSELAYGPSSAGIIGPNSVLVFEVELLKVGQ
ncbi:FKBP-type peptidyl-prolyl cis-trans isomerase [bacterium]|nr:FKBP-type peptidyl-prolyl cis-trans isomerase [bacterium]